MKNVILKFTKMFSICMIFVMVCALSISSVSAASAPSSITVKKADRLSDLVTNYEYGFTIFETSDGKTVYCMDVDLKPLTNGQKATLVGNGDAGLLYLLQNGYPNKKIMGNDEGDKYITQAAIWWYVNEGKLSNEFKNATKETDSYELVSRYIKPMVEKARSAKDTQVKPSMTVTDNGTTMTLSKDGKYYESAYISAALVGAKTYSVTTSKGSIIAEDGSTKNTFNSSERFKVRVPASEITKEVNISVNLSATGTVKKAKIYKTSDSAYQRVVGLYDDETVLKDSVKLSVKPKSNPVCEIKDNKYYGKKGNEVDKSTYEKECKKSCQVENDKYYGKDGSVVDKKTYENECLNTCVIIDDKYYGKDGNVVDEATFNSECGQEVVVPNTSSNVSPLAIALGMLTILGGASIVICRGRKLI